MLLYEMQKMYQLKVGEIKFCRTPCIITTILGSCVAVTLWDKEKGFGGMIHYLLPEHSSMNTLPLSYGKTAITILINKFLNNTSKLQNIEAKIFGGASQYQIFDIGNKNVEIARKMLKDSDIKIKAEHTGGRNGIKILLDTSNGIVKLKQLNTLN